MRWLRTKIDPGTDSSGPQDTTLARLTEAGAEVVLFVPGCTAGHVCEMARMLDSGRIPLGLADPTPLAECTNREGCACRYDAWPNAPSS